MALDPSIPLQFRFPEIQGPANSLAKVQGIRNLIGRNDLMDAQAQDYTAQAQQRVLATQAAEAQKQREDAFWQSLPDPPEDAPPQFRAALQGMKAGALPRDFKALQELAQGSKRKIGTAKPGDVVFDEADPSKPLLTVPDKPAAAPSAVQEYQFAQAQGYKGTFDQWKKENARAGASNTSVSYGAPVAGVDAQGNPVFFQPEKGGGKPAIIPGVAPPKKEAPAALQEKLAQNAVTLAKIDKALELVGANPESLGLKNYAGDAIMQRVDPAGVEVRAMIADIGGQKIHDRSGAAVTVGEAERLKPYIPAATDAPETVVKKLKLFRQEYAAMQQAINSGASIAQASAKAAGSGWSIQKVN